MDHARVIPCKVEIDWRQELVNITLALCLPAHHQTFPRRRVPIHCDLESKLLHLCACFQELLGGPATYNGLSGPILQQPSLNPRQEVEQWQRQLRLWAFKPFHDPRWASTIIEWFLHTCRPTSVLLRQLCDGQRKSPQAALVLPAEHIRITLLAVCELLASIRCATAVRP